MPPKESSPLLADPEKGRGSRSSSSAMIGGILPSQYSFGSGESTSSPSSFLDRLQGLFSSSSSSSSNRQKKRCVFIGIAALLLSVALSLLLLLQHQHTSSTTTIPPDLHHNKNTGPYKLLERQQGHDFFQYYDFLDGPDSLGSAGYNVYVGQKRAMELGLVNVTREDASSNQEYVYLQSAANNNNKSNSGSSTTTSSSSTSSSGPRESIRLEGKRRYNRGLFVLDVAHMPAGCGVWPAFWLTDEEHWPDHGEIDIVEGINRQTVVKTALHTSESCSMYAHVPTYNKTGVWDVSTGIPDTWTGQPNFNVTVEADNCWVMAPHQWANQGCVAVSTQPDTLGAPLNAAGGGIYVLEWDPAAGYIKSWVFPRNQHIPVNLQNSIDSAAAASPAKHAAAAAANNDDKDDDAIVVPQPETWGLPYALFAIGEGSGCSSDHFQNMRLIFNLAFCGTVAGNRFARDCPREASMFASTAGTTTTTNTITNNKPADPIETCNNYIASNPKELEEAYWKVRGVYVYERE